MPQIKLMPTGGVDLTTVKEFIRAGAVCVGIGSQMVDPKAIAARDFGAITELAKDYVEAVRKARSA